MAINLFKVAGFERKEHFAWKLKKTAYSGE